MAKNQAEATDLNQKITEKFFHQHNAKRELPPAAIYLTFSGCQGNSDFNHQKKEEDTLTFKKIIKRKKANSKSQHTSLVC